MPLELVLTRSTSLTARHEPHDAILRAEFEPLLLSAPSVVRRADGSFRVFYPDRGDPWFLARFEPLASDPSRGNVILSSSTSNHRFLRNFADSFDQALRFADALSASVFEDVRGQRITRENVDEIMAPGTSYGTLIAETFRASTRRALDADQAALEFPLGPVDWVSEYFRFDLSPPAPLSPADLSRAIESMQGGFLLKAAPTEKGIRLALAEASAPEKIVAHIAPTTTGSFSIRPAHHADTFSVLAPLTLRAALALHGQVGGSLSFQGRPWTPELASIVEPLTTGLGVTCFEALGELLGRTPEPTGAAPPKPAEADAPDLAQMIFMSAAMARMTNSPALIDRFLVSDPERVDEKLVDDLWACLVAGAPERRQAMAEGLALVADRIEAAATVDPARRRVLAGKLRAKVKSWFGGGPGPEFHARAAAAPPLGSGPPATRTASGVGAAHSAPPKAWTPVTKPRRDEETGRPNALVLVVVALCLLGCMVFAVTKIANDVIERGRRDELYEAVRSVRRKWPPLLRDAVPSGGPVRARVIPVDLMNTEGPGSPEAVAVLEALDPALSAPGPAATLVGFLETSRSEGYACEVTVVDLATGALLHRETLEGQARPTPAQIAAVVNRRPRS